MTTESIDIKVNSSELNGLINQLQTAEQSFDDVRRSADQAANSVDRVGNSTSGAAGEVQGFSISGAKAAVAGAAMGVAMVAVEKAMELAAAATAAINQATLDYIRSSQAGRASIDAYTDALERSKQEIAVAIADTGLYQKAAQSLAEFLPKLTTEVIKGIGAIEDTITIYMEYKGVIDGVVSVIQKMIPGLQSVLDIIAASKIVWDGTVQVLDSVATSIRESTTEVEEQTPAIQTATSAWDLLTDAMDDNIDSAINVGREYRAVAAVSNLAGNLVSFFRPSLRAQEEAANAAAAASAAYATQMEAEAQALRALVAARNSADDQVQSQIQAVLADDSIEVRIARERLLNQATDEQIQYLLAIWRTEDRAREQRTRDEAEAARESVRIQAEANRQLEMLAQHRANREREIRTQSFDEAQLALEDSLAELLDPAQQRMDMIFGGGNLDELMERTGKFSNRLTTDLLNMSDEGAAALGTLNMAMNDMAGGFGAALGSALMSGDRLDKALKKSVAGMLSSLGQTYLAMGAGLLIPPPFNPLGNPVAGGVMIGVGGGMLGLSAAFGGIGGGEKGKKSPSTAAPSSMPGQSQTTYTNVSFGFVGDRRAAGREVADVQEDARRRGL